MTSSIKDLPRDQRPISEQFRIVAKRWVDADAAARLLDEMKTTVLEQRKTDWIRLNGDMPDAKAERIIKSEPAWAEYIREMCHARTNANLLKKQLEYLEMRAREQAAAEATRRAEMKL